VVVSGATLGRRPPRYRPRAPRHPSTAWRPSHSLDAGGPADPTGPDGAIFERFTRLNDPRTSGSAGAGLGLAITRDVIQRHGGTIGVDPEYDRGTRFRVTLPLVGSTSGTGS